MKYLKVISKRDNNATLPEPVKDMSDFPCCGVNKQSDRSGWIVCQQQWTEFALVGRPITLWNLLLWQGNGNIWFSVLVDSEASWTRIFKCMWRINSEPCRPQTQHVVAQVSLVMRAQLFLFQWKCIQVCQFRENSLDNG